MVFQNYALFPHMTVGENLAFPLQVRKLDEADDRRQGRPRPRHGADGPLRRPPTGAALGRPAAAHRARAALVFEPELVLMDEPLGALDKQLREHMQYEIRHLHERLNVTVVYVTHDQSEALTMSDRVAVFDDGRIQQLASPEDLYERPENAFVAQFIGENNRLFGTVEAVDGGSPRSGSRTAPPAARSRSAAASRRAHQLSIRPERCWSGDRVRREPHRGAGAGADLPRRPHPLPAGGSRQRRLHRQGAEQPGHPTLQVGAGTTVGWRTEDCRALDA